MPQRRTGATVDATSHAYVAQLQASAGAEFARARTLRESLRTESSLTVAEKLLIVRQALILIEQNYAHLPLKRAMHAVDPVQRLKLLEQRLESDTADATPESTELALHNQLTEIFTSLRDLHTNYLLPEPFANIVAILPFMVEDCYDGVRRRYLVTHIVPGFENDTFLPGVEIVHWNGMPIERAVTNNSQRYAGSNPEARHARGIQTLTTRALRVAPPPDEDWVVVGYRTAAGRDLEQRFDWLVNPTPSGVAGKPLSTPARASTLGIDIEQQIVLRARAALFAPGAKQSFDTARRKLDDGRALGALESTMPHVLQAERITTRSGAYGYVRLRSFNVEPQTLIDEFCRLLRALPKRGLIIDVRGNGGGNIHAGEYLLQLLTPRTIEPEPVQFINTRLNLDICKRNDATSSFADLSVWKESMQLALQTGSSFSAGFPISDPTTCNAIGQRYFGPVALITDALCYSTTDIFAAGFQDHEVGTIIGTHSCTGAGGANVWEHEHLTEYAFSGPGSVYQALPQGAGMRVAMRRTLRVGRRAGTPVEDLGVVPDCLHRLTQDDVLHGNIDLKEFAGQVLKGKPVRALAVSATPARGKLVRLDVAARGMQQIDVYVDGRPIHSTAVRRGRATIDIGSVHGTPAIVELRGFAKSILVARYVITWDEISDALREARLKPRRSRLAKSPRQRGSVRSRTAMTGDSFTITPNHADDSAAAAEISIAPFGGSALVAPTAAAVSQAWRTAKSLLVLLTQVNTHAPQRSRTFDGTVGDAAHAARTSDHNPWVRDGDIGVVTACDVTHDPEHGCDAAALAESIRASRDERVKYIIWNHRIANASPMEGQAAWAWRTYRGANAHERHIHVSVRPDKAHYDSAVDWALPA